MVEFTLDLVKKWNANEPGLRQLLSKYVWRQDNQKTLASCEVSSEKFHTLLVSISASFRVIKHSKKLCHTVSV